MADAFIKLHRKMLDWEWYDDLNTKVLFLHCLLKANWKPGSWHGVNYNAGEFITSINSLAAETHLSPHQVRTALEHLMTTGEVASRWQSKCRVITVNNWNEYQVGGKVNGKNVATSWQDGGKMAATDKEHKERKEGEERKNIKYYPNDEKLDQAFSDYVAMRKFIKKPMSDRAVELAIEKLNKLSGGDNDLAIEILNQSTSNSWQGLFPLKDYEQKTAAGTTDWSKV